MDYRWLFFIVAGYLSGSILFGYEIPRLWKGVDVRRESDDGNPGTFNAFACGGIGCGIVTLMAELLKGIWPVALCVKNLGEESLLFALVMAAPVAGHACSIFHHGKGGKAIAVSFGVLLGLFPFWRPLVILACYYLLFSLAVPVKSHAKRTVFAFLCFGITCIWMVKQQAVLLGSLLMSGIVVYKHCAGAIEAYRRGEKWRLE